MSKKIFLCALFLLCSSFSLVAQTTNQQWEYLVITQYEKNLNDLGQQNWELVGVIPPSLSDGNSSGPAGFIFKRPFDVLRSSREAELKKRLEEQSRQSQVELVNLDALEIQSARTEDEEKAKARIAQAIKQVKGLSVLSFKPYASIPNANDRRIGGELVNGDSEREEDDACGRETEVRAPTQRSKNC